MNNKVIKAGIGYTIGNYLLKGLSFFTIPLFVRFLNPSDYGKYSVFTSYEAMLFVVIGLAIHSSYKNARYKYGTIGEGAKLGNDYHSYISTTMLMIICSCIMFLIVANLFFPFLGRILDLDRLSINMLIIFSFGSAIICCFNVDVALDYRFQSFLKIAGINAISNIFLSILLIITVFKDNPYMGRVVGSTIPVALLASLIIYQYLKIARPCNFKSFLSWGIKYSLPIIPHGLSQIVLNQFDRIMINSFVGSYPAGIYSFAYNIYSIVSVTAISIDNAWGPWFYEKMNDHDLEAIREKSKYYMLFLCSFVSCVLLASPELIKLLGTDQYYDAISCAIPLIASGFFAFMYNIPAGVEYYYEKTRHIATGTALAAIINISLNYYVINHFNYISVAYTTLLTYFLYFCFHYIMAWKINGSCLFSTKTVLTCSCIVLIVAIFTMIYINSWLLRWIIMVVFFSGALFYEEKKLSLGYRLKQKVMKR